MNEIAEYIPLAIGILIIVYITVTNQKEPADDDDLPILPPEDWSEEWAEYMESEVKESRLLFKKWIENIFKN